MLCVGSADDACGGWTSTCLSLENYGWILWECFFPDAGGYLIHSRRLHDKNFFIGPTMQPVYQGDKKKITSGEGNTCLTDSGKNS